MKKTKVLLITPPFTQPNTPYPATMQLTGFLKERGVDVCQFDLGISVFTEIFTQKTLKELFSKEIQKPKNKSKQINEIVSNKDYYLANIDSVLQFLQGSDLTLAYRFYNHLQPRVLKSLSSEELELYFGSASIMDWAKYNASKFIEEIGYFIQNCFDQNFGFKEYAENLGLIALDFEPLLDALQKPTFIAKIIDAQMLQVMQSEKPTLVGFTIPFPGNLYSTLLAAKTIKEHFPECSIVVGGGYPNSELRWITEKRFFRFVDYICLDDGELPLLQLIKYIEKEIDESKLVRTYRIKDGNICYSNNEEDYTDFDHNSIATPNYKGIDLNKYVSFLSTINPMQRLWNDGRWNKMALAHGCYWAKCSFCDTSLDYIKRYSKPSIDTLINRITSIKQQTKCSGFHFVDEAAPPALLRELSIQLIERNITITWWVNIRFEKSFDLSLIDLMAKAGCVAVSGGLEVASDRLLKLMNKGTSIQQVAKVTHCFTENNIMVHAYLMYGFPTQTIQETIDALEVVRQLFENNLIQSGFWHRFALTEHSDIYQNPNRYSIELIKNDETQFARNDVAFNDLSGCNHDHFSEGLRVSLFNFMHGEGLDLPINRWFNFKTPKSSHPKDLIKRYLSTSN